MDQHPTPTLEQAFGGLAHGQRFTKIDLKSAYQQLMLDEASRELVTINTPKGLFRYTRSPLGIASTPAFWQRFIDQVTAGLEMTCTIMDDVLVSGRTDKEHYRNLDALFQRFQKYGLRVKLPKCFYCQESAVYMGRQLIKEGMRLTGERLKDIVDAPARRWSFELVAGNGELSGVVCCKSVDGGTSIECFAVDEEFFRLVGRMREGVSGNQEGCDISTMFGSLQPGSTDYSRGGRPTVWRWSGGVARTSGWLQPADRTCEPNIELASAELFSVG